MSLLSKLPQIMEAGREAYLEAKQSAGAFGSEAAFRLTESLGNRKEAGRIHDTFPARKDSGGTSENIPARKEPSGIHENILARGDNLPFMKFLAKEKGLEGKIDLIYIDPPFFSKTDYGSEIKLTGEGVAKIPAIRQKAYHDTWNDGLEEYLSMLIPRLYFMKDLLSEEGSFWIHLDWHAAHYVKVVLDEIFGEKNFVNEIIWHYKSGGVSKRAFAKKHDTLLFYAKSKNYYFAPRQEKSYNRDFKPYRFKGVKEYRDELGWYTMVNRKDVWLLDMVGRTSAERTGYVTQKPETLIERILESCTKEGALCADFFGGSGTMAAAADRLGRRWISCDIGRLAAINSHKRLAQQGAAYDFYEETEGEDGKAGSTNGEPGSFGGKAGSSGGEPGTSGRGDGALRAEVSMTPTGFSDTFMLRVRLLDYQMDPKAPIPVEEKYIPLIRKYMKENPLSLLAYWSVDCHYEAPVIHPEAFFCKERDSIKPVYETIGTDFGPVGIKAVDIFGNSVLLIIEKESIK